MKRITLLMLIGLLSMTSSADVHHVPLNASISIMGVTLKGRVHHWNEQAKSACVKTLLGNRRVEAEKKCWESRASHNYARVSHVRASYSFLHKECTLTFDVHCMMVPVPWIEAMNEREDFMHDNIWGK